MTLPFDDFDLEIQCEEVYDEDFYEMEQEIAALMFDEAFEMLDKMEADYNGESF